MGKTSNNEMSGADRRREDRYPVEAPATIRNAKGESIAAMAVNVSASGMLLFVDNPMLFGLGEEVEVEVALPETEKPFSVWGFAQVVRLEDSRTAVRLVAGGFYPLVHAEAGEPSCQ